MPRISSACGDICSRGGHKTPGRIRSARDSRRRSKGGRPGNPGPATGGVSAGSRCCHRPHPAARHLGSRPATSRRASARRNLKASWIRPARVGVANWLSTDRLQHSTVLMPAQWFRWRETWRANSLRRWVSPATSALTAVRVRCQSIVAELDDIGLSDMCSMGVLSRRSIPTSRSACLGSHLQAAPRSRNGGPASRRNAVPRPAPSRVHVGRHRSRRLCGCGPGRALASRAA